MPESHFKFAHTGSIIVNNSRTCLLLFPVMFVQCAIYKRCYVEPAYRRQILEVKELSICPCYIYFYLEWSILIHEIS